MNLDTKLADLEQQERIAIANVQRIQGAIAVVRQLQEEQDAPAPAEAEGKAAEGKVNGSATMPAKAKQSGKQP